jgi:predicted ATPase/DNA-binding CsgD family transcriptional regulator
MTEHPSIVSNTEAALRQGLPLPRTPLIGRETEVLRVGRLLDEGRLVTITGPGGIGKTRVAIEVARRQSRRVVFVALADLDRSGVAGAIFRACTAGTHSLLSGPIASGSHIMAGVWAGLAQEIARDPLVLVLDTFEHLTDAATLVSQVQGAIPDLTVLVTSRSRLGLTDERVVPLAGLNVDLGGPAVQLFTERCRGVGGDRDLGTAPAQAAVAEICRLMGGSPLAIELAAARTAVMSPIALLGQLQVPDDGRVLGLLAHGPVDLPTRQLSMRATMSWSYQLLDGIRQTLFRRLGVFPGSFCLDAAEHVCTGIGPGGDWLAPDALLDGIATLVDLHLIEPMPDAGAGNPADARFTMSGAPRAYAVELLEMSGEHRAVQGRMHEWVLNFARKAERGTYSADERRWLNRIDDELPLIRHSLTAFAQDSDAARGVTLAAGIAGFWTIRGPLIEALQWFRTFLAIDRAGGRLPDPLRAVAIGWANRLGLESGDLPDIDETRQARSTILAHPSSATLWLRSTDHLIYELINGLGAAAANTPPTSAVPSDTLKECLMLVAEGIGRARAGNDSYWLAQYLFWRAQLEWMAGRRDALPFAEEAVAVSQESKHSRIAAKSLALVAVCHMTQANWPGARESMQAALGNLKETGDLAGAIDAMTAMGVILVELGDMVQAAGFLRDAITEARRIGYGQGEIYGAWTVAYLACRHGLYRDAATMDDALAEHIGLVERGLPRSIFLGYVKSIETARVAAGLPPTRHPDGRGWGWLRARALELATKISTPVEDDETMPAPSSRHTRTAHRHDLTARELQILSAIASGQTNAQIAAALFLSAKTVMHHSTSIYRKLEVGGRAEAVALAYRTGLLQTIAR